MRLSSMFRLLRARATLLVIDEAGMSTVEYSIDSVYYPVTTSWREGYK